MEECGGALRQPRSSHTNVRAAGVGAGKATEQRLTSSPRAASSFCFSSKALETFSLRKELVTNAHTIMSSREPRDKATAVDCHMVNDKLLHKVKMTRQPRRPSFSKTKIYVGQLPPQHRATLTWEAALSGTLSARKVDILYGRNKHDYYIQQRISQGCTHV